MSDPGEELIISQQAWQDFWGILTTQTEIDPSEGKTFHVKELERSTRLKFNSLVEVWELQIVCAMAKKRLLVDARYWGNEGEWELINVQEEVVYD